MFLSDMKASAERLSKNNNSLDETLTRHFFNEMNRFEWVETRTFYPRRCYVSKRKIRPFQKVMKGVREISGPGTPVVITKWAIPEEYTFAVLNGDL